MPANRPLRVLVVGAGPMSVSVHMPILAGLRDKGEIILAQVCDIQRERVAVAQRKFKFLEGSGDAAMALERPDIDAVYIFGSAQMHYEYGLMALQSGKHLFIEKPIAPSYAQARALAQAAKARGLVAVAGHNRRFHKSLAAVRAHAGKARWRFAEVVFHKPEFDKPVLFGARSWLSANGIHGLDALVFMMGGLPEQITALAGERGSAEPAVFSAIMCWHDGAQGVFLCNNNAGARHEEYVFHGPGETLRISAAGLTIEKCGTVSTTAFPAVGDGFVAEHDAFLQAIHSAIEPPHSIAAIAPSLFLAELIENGFSGPVQLPQTEPQDVPPRRNPAAQSILVVQPAPLQKALAQLMPHYRLVSLEDVRQSSGARSDIIAAIFGQGAPPLPTDILIKLPKLGVVGIMGLSLAYHKPEALLARGVTLLNASAAYAESVAEFALGLAILGRRRAFTSDTVMSAGGWGTTAPTPGFKGVLQRTAHTLRPVLKMVGLEPPFLRAWRSTRWLSAATGTRAMAVRDLRGATVGLIGWGSNAQAFTKRLVQAGAQVMVYSEHAAVEDIRAAGGVPGSLREVLAGDIVSLHRGLSNGTHHFLGAPELTQLRPGAVLINVARGALIDPQALLARLKQGDVFACLDTFEDEPPATSDPLRDLPNVFLSSHIAGGSPDMHAAAAEEVVRKVASWLAGEAVEPVSAERLRTMS